MSLIVLNSKGSDPEDFSNYLSEQIKFPRDAEVCLVSSNINRKMMVDLEANIAAGSNSIGIQLGNGGLLSTGLRDGTTYTPHSPFMVDIETAGKNFPIKAVGTGIGNVINASLNNTDNIPISNIARGWAAAATAGAPFTLWDTPQVLDMAGSEGTRGDWTTVAGRNNIGTGGINTTSTQGGSATFPLGADFIKWVRLEGSAENNNFVDLKPLWNTHNGAGLGVFTPSATNRNIVGGGWCWRFRSDGADITNTLSLRGGIFDNTTFSKNNVYNVDSNLNRQSGGTAYTIWWELSDPTAAPGLQVDFYARKPGSKPDLGVNNKNAEGVINWARAALPAAPGELQTIGIRPVIDATGANPIYTLEAYTGIASFGNVYTTPPALANNATPGTLRISDPRDPATYQPPLIGDPVNFDLYRHLPLRMGCNTTGGVDYSIFCNAIHHDDTDVTAMSAGDLTNFSPYTFLLGDLSPTQQSEPQNLGGSWDAECRQVIRKATLASVLGYTTHFGRVTAAAMLPAQAGLPAGIDLGLTRPEALSLVVTLPDLPITGYYGNSAGDGNAGTLNLNSGGNSAAILGVIPFGNRPFKQPQDPNSINQRGEFFACPMENWICLNNPAPFSVSSLRCRITDSLGNKPQVLDTTSTITIKIKKRNSTSDYSQGGQASVFTTY